MLATVGTFDGVHRGHRFLLSCLKEEASKRGLTPLVVTFDRHPLSLVAPKLTPPAITSSSERESALNAEGVGILQLPFSPELRAMTGSQFVEMLRHDYGVKALMMGFNNHLGSDRSTRPEVPGVELVYCPQLPDDMQVNSSTIRELIASGRIDEANAMLSRPFALTGKVVHGKELGRTLGFPTANIEIPHGHVLPKAGVYAARVLDHDAVVNVGCRPTVDLEGSPVNIEAHIIGFSGNLYDHNIRIEFLRRIRDEHQFASLEELKSAINADISLAKS